MYLKIKFVPDSPRERVEKKSEEEWRILVRVPTENNAANNRVLEIVREAYPNQSVRIVSGHHARSKIVSIG